MKKIMSSDDAISLIKSGDTVALEDLSVVATLKINNKD